MNTPRHTPCDDLRTLLGSATDEETIAPMIAEHIATCPDCAQTEQAMTRLVARLRAATTADALPPQVEARLLAWMSAAGDAKPPAQG